MALKGVIQGAATQGGQLSGSGVTSVALSAPPEFVISGSPVTSAGTLDFQFNTPTLVAHGGTGMGSFAANSLIQAGLDSTAKFQSIPLPGLTSAFLDGSGAFSVPAGGGGPGGGVTSVDLAMSSEFAISGNPVTSAGVLTVGWRGPLGVAHGGTGLGSIGIGAFLRGGASSTAPLAGLPITNLTSTFLRGDGVFAIPINPGGTVQSVGMTMTSEFSITGSPIFGSGTIDLGFRQPLAVAHGGTSMGSFGPSVVLGGLSSTGPLQGLPLTNLSSTFLDGTGTFSFPPVSTGGGTGTVTSVDLSLSSEFRISGNPITTSGTLVAGFIQPLAVGHGGTGMGSFAASSILQAGLTSTGPFQSVALNNLTSNFLRGDGVFAAPPPPPAGGSGTVTSVDLALSSEFTVSGNPITTSGQIVVGWRGPLDVAHGGTGMGSFGPGIVMGGLTSTGDLQGLPLTNLTSNFLSGDGLFRIPINPGGTVQSVGLSMTSEFAIQRNPVFGSGTIDIGFVQPLAVAHGGTGLGSVGIGAILRGGLSSTAPFQGTPLTNLTSTFLGGDGVFRIPITPGGTVQSVALSMTSEFAVQGTPITGSGTFNIGFAQPLAIAHGGTGLGSFGIGAILKGGLSSTGPLQGLPLTNLTSNFLRGDGVFGVPPTPTGGAGTVTSVALVMSSEFIIAGSPITAAGTFLGSWVFQASNFIFGGPTIGTPGTPAFRALVNADIPQSMSGKTMSSSTFQNPTMGAQQLTFGSSIKWNMNSGAIAFLGMDSTAKGSMDTPANLPNAGSAILRVMQLGTGFTNLVFNKAWKWESAVAPVMSSGFSKVDVITLYLESTAVYGVALKDFR